MFCYKKISYVCMHIWLYVCNHRIIYAYIYIYISKMIRRADAASQVAVLRSSGRRTVGRVAQTRPGWVQVDVELDAVKEVPEGDVGYLLEDLRFAPGGTASRLRTCMGPHGCRGKTDREAVYRASFSAKIHKNCKQSGQHRPSVFATIGANVRRCCW